MADWTGKRVVVVGLARQGKALARFLTAQGAHVTVTDLKPAASLASSIGEFERLPAEVGAGKPPPPPVGGRWPDRPPGSRVRPPGSAATSAAPCWKIRG